MIVQAKKFTSESNRDSVQISLSKTAKIRISGGHFHSTRFTSLASLYGSFYSFVYLLPFGGSGGKTE